MLPITPRPNASDPPARERLGARLGRLPVAARLALGSVAFVGAVFALAPFTTHGTFDPTAIDTAVSCLP